MYVRERFCFFWSEISIGIFYLDSNRNIYNIKMIAQHLEQLWWAWIHVGYNSDKFLWQKKYQNIHWNVSHLTCSIFYFSAVYLYSVFIYRPCLIHSSNICIHILSRLYPSAMHKSLSFLWTFSSEHIWDHCPADEPLEGACESLSQTQIVPGGSGIAPHYAQQQSGGEPEGPRYCWALLQGGPRKALHRSAWDWTWQLWCCIFCEYFTTWHNRPSQGCRANFFLV